MGSELIRGMIETVGDGINFNFDDFEREIRLEDKGVCGVFIVMKV